jgi:hypothetical protein
MMYLLSYDALQEQNSVDAAMLLKKGLVLQLLLYPFADLRQGMYICLAGTMTDRGVQIDTGFSGSGASLQPPCSAPLRSHCRSRASWR